jgi:hypothetical protein
VKPNDSLDLDQLTGLAGIVPEFHLNVIRHAMKARQTAEVQAGRRHWPVQDLNRGLAGTTGPRTCNLCRGPRVLVTFRQSAELLTSASGYRATDACAGFSRENDPSASTTQLREYVQGDAPPLPAPLYPTFPGSVMRSMQNDCQPSGHDQ